MTTARSRSPSADGLLPVVCAVAVLPSLVFAASRVLLPGDGVLIDLDTQPPDAGGLYLSATNGKPASLRDGDSLIAINDRPLDEWFQPPLSAEAWKLFTSEVGYLVERDSSVIEIPSRLTRVNLVDSLLANWPSHLFLIYLLVIGIFVFVRRPDAPAARGLLLLASLTFGSGLVFFQGLQPIDLVRGWSYLIFLWADIPLFGLSMAAILHFSLLFPHKRVFLIRHPWAAPLIYLGPWLLFGPLLATPWNGAASNISRLLLALRLSGLFTATFPALGLAIMVHGYRKTFNPKERRQTRWLMWGAAVVLVPWVGGSVLPSLLERQPLLPQFVVGLLWLILPTAFTIAIVRESLFDIDRVINRTLVYSLLTLVLVGVYFGVVVVLQQITVAVTGQQSPLAVVLSTLLIAAIFNPLRERIQSLIDRRFYRSRYDAARALEQLSLEMQQRVELGELSQSMLSVVQDSLQPVHLSLWLRQSERR